LSLSHYNPRNQMDSLHQYFCKDGHPFITISDNI
jgi:hypothetical protein